MNNIELYNNLEGKSLSLSEYQESEKQLYAVVNGYRAMLIATAEHLHTGRKKYSDEAITMFERAQIPISKLRQLMFEISAIADGDNSDITQVKKLTFITIVDLFRNKKYFGLHKLIKFI